MLAILNQNQLGGGNRLSDKKTRLTDRRRNALASGSGHVPRAPSVDEVTPRAGGRARAAGPEAHSPLNAPRSTAFPFMTAAHVHTWPAVRPSFTFMSGDGWGGSDN